MPENDLKKIIFDSIQNNYQKISNKEKEILNKIVLFKILNLDYYKNRYNTASIATFNRKQYFFITNNYDLNSSSDISAKFHRDSNIYTPYSEDYDSIKELIINNEIFNRINDFKDIVLKSQELQEYVTAIIMKQREDSDFIPTIFSFSFLFKDFNDYFGNSYINSFFKEEGFDYIFSEKIKKEVYLNSKNKFSEFDNESINIFLNNWKKSYENRILSINNDLKKIININKYYEKYNKKVNNIIENVYNMKKFLFNPININDISFSYYEISNNNEVAGWNNGIKFTLNKNLEFSENLINKYGINKSDIYNINYDNNYYDIQNLLKENIINYENELTCFFKSSFYGLDYIDSAIKGNIYDRFYIIAKYHNETVGMISFRTEENNNNNNSVIKFMEYICIKDNFRSIGLANMLYQKLAYLAIENNNILCNSTYSKQGSIKLPKIKDKIRNINPDFLFIDKDVGINKNSFDKYFLTIFNEYFINYLSALDRNKNFNLKEYVPFLNTFYREKVNLAKEKFSIFNEEEERILSKKMIEEFMSILKCELDKKTIKTYLNNSLKDNSLKIIK